MTIVGRKLFTGIVLISAFAFLHLPAVGFPEVVQAQEAGPAIASDPFWQIHRPPIILTVDGISPGAQFTSQEAFTEYLKADLRKSSLGNTQARIDSFRWTGDTKDTLGSAGRPGEVDRLATLIKKLSDIATTEGRTFVILTHSWGGVLSYLALRHLELQERMISGEVDLLITIHTPLNVRWRFDWVTSEVIAEVGRYVKDAPQKLASVKRWINYFSHPNTDPIASEMPADVADNIDTGKDHSKAHTDPQQLESYVADIKEAMSRHDRVVTPRAVTPRAQPEVSPPDELRRFSFQDKNLALQLLGVEREPNGDIRLVFNFTNRLEKPDWFGIHWDTPGYLLDNIGKRSPVVSTSFREEGTRQLLPAGHPIRWWIRFGAPEPDATVAQVSIWLLRVNPYGGAGWDPVEVSFIDVPLPQRLDGVATPRAQPEVSPPDELRRLSFQDKNLALQLLGVEREPNGDIRLVFNFTNRLEKPEWFGFPIWGTPGYLLDNMGKTSPVVSTSFRVEGTRQLLPAGHPVKWWIRFGAPEAGATVAQVSIWLGRTNPQGSASSDSVEISFIDVPVRHR